MRAFGWVALAAVAGGCTSVKMVHRDGCWVKRTEKIFGRVQEEIGPCSREQPKWADDRLTRLVQECVAQADYRWQGRAVEAWSRHQPYPAAQSQEEVLRTCMGEARVGLVDQNEELKRRVAELSADRDVLRAGADQDRAHLRASEDQLAKYLGEAANKPIPTPTATATATSTSDGKATNENGTTLASDSTTGAGANGTPAIPVLASPASPAQPASANTRAVDAEAAVRSLRAARPAAPRKARKSAVCSVCDAPASVPEAAAGGTAAAAP